MKRHTPALPVGGGGDSSFSGLLDLATGVRKHGPWKTDFGPQLVAAVGGLEVVPPLWPSRTWGVEFGTRLRLSVTCDPTRQENGKLVRENE